MYLVTSGLGAAEAMGPPRDPTLPIEQPDVQQQIADVWAYLWSNTPDTQAIPSSGPSFTQVLNQNAGKIALGAGAFLLLLAVKK